MWTKSSRVRDGVERYGPPPQDLRSVQQGGLQLLHRCWYLRAVRTLLLLPDEAQQAQGVPGALVPPDWPRSSLIMSSSQDLNS
ncbi:hypothetical protein F7725_004171 [Dissostichus mawsoni]|uniref:Uncharacterized protein n=1 Tax=Dissostichus mawsoni TaxID=36200 RepID=A0A7J5XJC7_DISMA|nr:hypothetical protein F7725_004171 [Dissostichus mawsoni]